MKRSVSLFTAACAVVLLAGTSARADDLAWTFNWTPSNIPSNLRLIAPTSSTKLSYLQLTNEPLNKPVGQAAGESDLTMTGIKVFSDAPRSNPDSLASSAPVTFSLRLTDATTGQFHDFAYMVQFGGLISKFSAKVTALVTPSAPYTDVPIGAGLYTISSPSYTPPGPPDSDNPSAISVSVSVRPVAIQKAPEPSTMLLSCVGLSFLGLARWRKRRQAIVDLA